MKRLFLIPLLALAMQAQPVPTVNVTAEAKVGYIIEPGLTFEWHCESTTAEFSRGDATGTLGSAAVIDDTKHEDGAASLSIPTAGDSCYFTVSEQDIVNGDSGTITMWVNMVDAAGGSASYLYATDAGDTNYVKLYMLTDQTVRMRHCGAGNIVQATTTETFATNEWFKLTAKWQRGTSPYLSIQINDTAAVENTTTNLTQMNTSPTVIHFGERNSVAANYNIDNVHVYGVFK